MPVSGVPLNVNKHQSVVTELCTACGPFADCNNTWSAIITHVTCNAIMKTKQIFGLVLMVDNLASPDCEMVGYHAYRVIHIPVQWGWLLRLQCFNFIDKLYTSISACHVFQWSFQQILWGCTSYIWGIGPICCWPMPLHQCHFINQVIWIVFVYVILTNNPAVAGKPWWVQLVSFLNSYFQGCSLGLGVCEAGHHILTYSRTAVYSVSFRGGCCTNCHIEHQSHPPSLGRICNPWLCLIEAVDLQCPSASVWVCPLREVLDMPIVHHPLWEGLDWIVQMIKYWCWSDAH